MANSKAGLKNTCWVANTSAVSLEPVLAVMRHAIDVTQHHAPAFSGDQIGWSKGLEADYIGEHLSISFPASVMSSEEEEKKRISHELHDGLGQLLTSINLHVQQCLASYESMDRSELPQVVKDSLAAISSMTKQAIGEVRSICCALRPSILDDLGVLAAISWQCRQLSRGCSRIEVITDFAIEEALIPEHFKTVLYRIVQESLNNAVKYSQSNVVNVSLFQSGGEIVLCVRDSGVGFDMKQTASENGRGIGLVSMRERAEAIGGTLHINARVGSGVEVRAAFPVDRFALSG